MKTIVTLCLAGWLLAAGSLSAAQKTNCKCPHCPCTPEKHCGCFSEKGCPGGEMGCNCGMPADSDEKDE